MKKTISILLALLMLLSICVLGVSAVALEDGKYELPVMFIDDKKDKESFGNRFALQTGIVEVENGKRYVTIVMTTNAESMDFWYFADGSVKGDTKNATLVKNVVIAGQTYANGFRFPLMGDQTKVGIKFHASGMPISPTARVSLDYSKIVPLTAEEPTEAATEIATEVADVSTEAVDATETPEDSAEPSAQETAVVEIAETEPDVFAMEDDLAEPQSVNRSAVYIVAIVAAVVIAAVILLIVKKKKK